MAMVVPRSGRGAAHVSFVVQNAVKTPIGTSMAVNYYVSTCVPCGLMRVGDPTIVSCLPKNWHT